MDNKNKFWLKVHPHGLHRGYMPTPLLKVRGADG